jgi:hypothetical protein
VFPKNEVDDDKTVIPQMPPRSNPPRTKKQKKNLYKKKNATAVKAK